VTTYDFARDIVSVGQLNDASKKQIAPILETGLIESRREAHLLVRHWRGMVPGPTSRVYAYDQTMCLLPGKEDSERCV